jgi:cell wall-associated NlpC family hydrolase
MKAMNYTYKILPLLLLIAMYSCVNNERPKPVAALADTTLVVDTTLRDSSAAEARMEPADTVRGGIDTKKVQPADLVSYAQDLIGIPYKYASADPVNGFDCSGFITYVFNHFGITVPRSSVDFTNQGKEISPEDARPGDLILFTGTDSTIRVVGHMGIVISEPAQPLRFIHSSSGKANGVTISPLEGYYRSRFVKVIRVFK